MIQQTKEKLQDLKLHHMLHALSYQLTQPHYEDMSFEERFSLLVEAQWLERENNRVRSRLRRATIRESQADIESVDFSVKRNLIKKELMTYCSGNWITQGHNLIITGATGAGKTYLASALGNYFCRMEKKIVMTTLNELLGVLLLQRDASEVLREYSYMTKADLIIIDEWLRDPVSTEHSRELLTFLDERYRKKSVLLASQLEVGHWHSQFLNPNTGDAILDRVVHNSYRITLKGESMRKRLSPVMNKEVLKNDQTGV